MLLGAGLRSRSRDRSWSRSESTVLHGVGVGVVKFYRHRIRPGVAGHRPSTDNDLGRTVMHRLENIETQEGKQSGSVEIKLMRDLVFSDRTPSDKGYWM